MRPFSGEMGHGDSGNPHPGSPQNPAGGGCLCSAAGDGAGSFRGRGPGRGGASHGRRPGDCGLRVRIQFPRGADRNAGTVPGICGAPFLPEDFRRPAQRGGMRYGPSQCRRLPGRRDRDLHRKKARQLLLSRQGVLRGDGGSPGGGASGFGGRSGDQDL